MGPRRYRVVQLDLDQGVEWSESYEFERPHPISQAAPSDIALAPPPSLPIAVRDRGWEFLVRGRAGFLKSQGRVVVDDGMLVPELSRGEIRRGDSLSFVAQRGEDHKPHVALRLVDDRGASGPPAVDAWTLASHSVALVAPERCPFRLAPGDELVLRLTGQWRKLLDQVDRVKLTACGETEAVIAAGAGLREGMLAVRTRATRAWPDEVWGYRLEIRGRDGELGLEASIIIPVDPDDRGLDGDIALDYVDGRWRMTQADRVDVAS